jgi:LysR family transcriptional regulator, transcriptional activator of the cysJI operon
MRLISQQIRVFDAVVRRKSFTRAARELRLTQPAITQHMHVLEDMCGVKLVERVGNTVLPTDAGLVLHQTSKQLIGMEHDLESVIIGLRQGTQGSLGVGTDTTGGMNILLRILQRFRPEFPDIDVRLSFGSTTEILDNLSDRTVDAAVVRGYAPPNLFEVSRLCPDEVMFVVSSGNPLAEKGDLQLADVADVPLILAGPGSTTRTYVVDQFRQAGLNPRIAMEFNSTEHTKKAVEANLGAGVISRWVIEHELRLGLLVPVRVAGFPLIREYHLVQRKQSPVTPALTHFLSTVEEVRPELHFNEQAE